MLKYILFIQYTIAFLCLISLSCFAQSEGEQIDSITVQKLIAPSSPGFVLLGVEPSNIDKPSTPTDVALSISNATNNFTTIPKTFALDLAPGWIFDSKNISYEKTKSNSFWQNVKQSAAISLATNTKTDSLTQLGVGLKFSLRRGTSLGKGYTQVDSIARTFISFYSSLFSKTLDTLIKHNAELTEIDDILSNGPTSNTAIIENAKLRQQIIIDSLASKLQDSLKKGYSTQFKRIRAILQKADFSRYGFKVDLAGGIVYDYPYQSTQNSELSRGAMWLTFGHEQKMWSLLFVARVLFEPKITHSINKELRPNDLTNGDFGARLIINNINKFSFSTEYIYRKNFKGRDNFSTFRYDVNINYQIQPNRLLALTFGRNFEGERYREGNLIAALNLILGFGNKQLNK